MDKILDVKYDAAGTRITTCVITFESGLEVIGSAYSDYFPQMNEKVKEIAKHDAMQQLEKAKFQFVHLLNDTYISSWKKFMNEIDQKLLHELKKRDIKLRNPQKRAEWIKENVKINSINKVNQVYLYPDTDDEEMLFAYDEQVRIREEAEDIFVEFGGIIDLMAPLKGKSLADDLKAKGIDVKPEEYYENGKEEQEEKSGKTD